MSRIVCGWCGDPTPDIGRCTGCGRDCRIAHAQRGVEPPEATAGTDQRRLLDEARDAIEERGGRVTVESLADELDRSPRTIRRWKQELGLS